jgi:hypothetical protein
MVIILVISNSCLDQYTEVMTAWSPVYMTYDELREAVKVTSPQELKKPGKIYFKDNYIFINEELKGVHIFDYSNPSNPVNKGFIEIPGNADIAIKNNILYADSYIDLVAIDISDLNNIKETARVKGTFSYTVPSPENNDYRMAKVDQEKGVVVDWELKNIRQEMEYNYYPIYYAYRGGMEYDLATLTNKGGVSNPSSTSTFGIGGSMARFGLYSDYLYAVDSNTLYMFDVKSDHNPKSIGKQSIGWNIETMFIYDKNIFFGTTSGMVIYSLQVPTVPNYIGQFWHTTSCDPVVVDNGYAYVTLRGGTTCGGTVNRLDIIKLTSTYTNNTLVASYPMTGPYGLGIDGNTLFVCDGDAGLKVYDVADKLTVDSHKISGFPAIHAYDVIPVNGMLFMIGDDGFYLYDYSNLKNISLLSHIPVAEND